MGGSSKLNLLREISLESYLLTFNCMKGIWNRYSCIIQFLDNSFNFRYNPPIRSSLCNEDICWVGSPWFWSAMWLLSFQACLLLSLNNSQSGSLLTWFESLLCQPPSVSWLHFARKWQQIFHIWYIWLTFGYIWAFLGAGVCSAPERVGLVPTVTHVKVSQCMQPKNIVNAHNATL